MNKLFKTGLWIALVIFAPMVARGAGNECTVVTFEIPASVIVSGPKVCFNDLGTIREGQSDVSECLKQVKLGSAPAPGIVRNFSRNYLNSIIRQYNLPVTIYLQMGEQVAVKSLAACIRRAEIEQTIQNLFTEKKPHLISKWVELHNIPEMLWLNRGEWKIEVLPIGNPSEVGNALFRVVLTKENESRILNISGKIRATALVYRAIRNITYQALINTTDFELVEMELQSGKELIGEIPSQMRSIKAIKQGEFLRTDWFQPIPLVLRNQEVKVVVRDENVVIKILGVAKVDGWLGDEILINNPDGHKTFKARVTGKGIVELNIQ